MMVFLMIKRYPAPRGILTHYSVILLNIILFNHNEGFWAWTTCSASCHITSLIFNSLTRPIQNLFSHLEVNLLVCFKSLSCSVIELSLSLWSQTGACRFFCRDFCKQTELTINRTKYKNSFLFYSGSYVILLFIWWSEICKYDERAKTKEITNRRIWFSQHIKSNCSKIK